MTSVSVLRCSNVALFERSMTVRATNLNFLESNASAGPKVLISFLYGYVEGHMTLNDFS